LHVRYAGEGHDADAVRQMVDDPDLGVTASRNRDRLEPDLNRGVVLEPIDRYIVDLEAIVGCIDRKQSITAGRQRQRTNLSALERREWRGCMGVFAHGTEERESREER